MFDNYADELRYSFKAGYTIGEKLGISVRLDGIEALDRADNEFFPRNDLEYLLVGPQFDYYVTPSVGITASMWRFTRAHNVPNALTGELGVFFIL